MIIWISKLMSIFSTTWQWYHTTSTSHISDEIEKGGELHDRRVLS